MRGAFDPSGWRQFHFLMSREKAEKMWVVMVCGTRIQRSEIKYPYITYIHEVTQVLLKILRLAAEFEIKHLMLQTDYSRWAMFLYSGTLLRGAHSNIYINMLLWLEWKQTSLSCVILRSRTVFHVWLLAIRVKNLTLSDLWKHWFSCHLCHFVRQHECTNSHFLSPNIVMLRLCLSQELLDRRSSTNKAKSTLLQPALQV